MSEEGSVTAYCHACGAAMDVTTVAPFSNVGCPGCGKHTRVKREFGPYTLVRTHAIGGMSVVFVGHDNALEREVAVKILSEGFSADEKRIAAFEQEARLTASISHPHVVRLLTTGRAFGRYYIAMEFVPGGHLERRIRDQGSMPEKEVLELALQVADGLRAAHGAGLIHRDIKPGNILLDGEGNAKIVDFGLALVTHGGHAKAEEVWATPYYVPPEAIDGRTEDFRSDMYAFGATIYHALAGKPPCREESMATSKLREAKKRVAPLDQAAPWLGLETCAVVDRAMAYDPGGRFSSYEEMIEMLRSASHHAEEGAGPQPAPAGAGQPARQQRRAKSRRTTERIGMVAGALAVLVAIGFGIWWVGRSGQVPDEPVANGGGPVEAPGDPGTPGPPNGGDPDAALRIGRLYRSAQEALAGKDYPLAESRFAELLDDKSAQEPTATLAGVESAIAALLDGRSADARSRALAVTGHVETLPAGVDPACAILGEAAGRLAELPPATGAASAAGTPSELAAALLLGLKNWEQGCHDDAIGWLEPVASPDSAGGSEWGATYRELAARYLADHKILAEHDFTELPGDVAGCQALKRRLDDGLKALQTRGRAPFNLRNRQLEIARHARRLQKRAEERELQAAEDREDEAATLAASMPAIEEFIAGSEFAEAAERLKQIEPADSGEVIQQQAWLYLAQASAGFLGDLLDDARQGIAGVKLATRDGKTSYDRVTGAGEDGLLLAAAGGQAVEVPWSRLAPADVMVLHSRLVRNESNQLERSRRHEQAIAYEFLVGDRERAESAAERLSESSPTFRQRWTDAMHALQM